MTKKELEVAVAAAEAAIDPKLTGMARYYRSTIFEWLPEVCQLVIEAVDDHRKADRVKADENP